MAEVFKDDNLQLKIEDGIIFGVIYAENMTLTCARQIVDSRYSFTKGKKYSTLIDISRLKSITKEARDYLSQGRAVENLSATAFYSDTILSQIVAKFFLSFNKPNLPAKIFSNQKKALNWLKEMNAN